ncbi:MAG: LysM peptidoglycan-binding domain-containing protein [Alphaproteobacteria bacterium]|nr:LysM peptidoglycan-binding domain-containing protein [Alphaproteobacteria bacterium]
MFSKSELSPIKKIMSGSPLKENLCRDRRQPGVVSPGFSRLQYSLRGMAGSILMFLTFMPGLTGVFAQQADFPSLVKRYIEQYQNIAIREMMVYRIPASITLAQGIHESNAGRSRLALEANNHFGIKCHKEWFGKTYYQDDDLPNECFRKYDSPIESFRDHSYFLTQRDRYKNLFDLEVNDYKGWARGLQAAGYATNPKYAEILIRTIETYSLFRFDQASFTTAFGDSLSNLDDPARQAWLRKFIVVRTGPGNRYIFENNNLEMTIARRDDNVYLLARDFELTVTQILKYNDLPYATALKPGQIVYLEPKRRRAAADNHVVQQGDNLYSISQAYGIKLKMLRKRNEIPEGMEPFKGMVLRLR